MMFNKEEYVGHLEPTIEVIENEKIYTLKLIQMSIPYHTQQYNNPTNDGRTSQTRQF